MNRHHPTIFLSAAEASGDDHGARLIRALRRRIPQATFIGAAGEKMVAAGCQSVADLTHRAAMGGGPLLQLGYWYRTVRRLKEAIRQTRPDVHIPIDSPALNWHLAAAAKSVGAKVFYYIAPQVWAWAPRRVKKLSRLADQVACILPFEQRYLRDRGVRACYVGHPLFDDFATRPEPMPDLSEAWSSGRWRVAMLPGSRPGEIARHAPALSAVAEAIRRRWPEAVCTFAVRTEQSAELIRGKCKGLKAELAVGRTRQVLGESHFAVVDSGTATLEAAYYGVPMVIFHHVGRLAWMIGRWLIQTPHLSLVNILAGRKIVPELMPWHGSRRRLTLAVVEAMDDLGYLFEARQALIDLVRPLCVEPPSSASDNAAELVARLLQDDSP